MALSALRCAVCRASVACRVMSGRGTYRTWRLSLSLSAVRASRNYALRIDIGRIDRLYGVDVDAGPADPTGPDRTPSPTDAEPGPGTGRDRPAGRGT